LRRHPQRSPLLLYPFIATVLAAPLLFPEFSPLSCPFGDPSGSSFPRDSPPLFIFPLSGLNRRVRRLPAMCSLGCPPQMTLLDLFFVVGREATHQPRPPMNAHPANPRPAATPHCGFPSASLIKGWADSLSQGLSLFPRTSRRDGFTPPPSFSDTACSCSLVPIHPNRPAHPPHPRSSSP